jgi:RNA polymerase sigma-70 factor (ECF subfamily)
MTSQEYASAYENGGYQQTARQLRSTGVDHEHASELAQAAWAKGWKCLDQLRDEDQLISWINAIARNLMRSAFRSERRVNQLGTISDAGRALGTDPIVMDVRRALERCRPRHSLVLQMVYCEGHSCAEVASQLRISTSAVYSVLARARVAFASEMGGFSPETIDIQRRQNSAA